MPVECPLYLNHHLFRPVGPCCPTKAVRREITRYYAWVRACLRGSRAGCDPTDAMTYRLAEKHRSPGILGDNDDPDAFWEPATQITLFPHPRPERSPYPIRMDALPLPVHQPSMEDCFTLADPGSNYQLPIFYPAEVQEENPRRPLYYRLAGVQPAFPRDHNTGYRPL